MNIYITSILSLGLTIALAGCDRKGNDVLEKEARSHAPLWSNVAQRPQMLKNVYASSPADSYDKIGQLIKQGGPLAFRDYLVFLSQKHPNIRGRWWMLPMCYGESSKQGVAPVINYFVECELFVKNGILVKEGVYTYADFVLIFEERLGKWKVAFDEAGWESYFMNPKVIGPMLYCPNESSPD